MMKTRSAFFLFVFLLASACVSHAQPAASSGQSAKERRQATSIKDGSRPDRSQAEAGNVKKAQREAKEKNDRKMTAAQSELSMGVASGTSQMGTARGERKNPKPEVSKEARKKPVLR